MHSRARGFCEKRARSSVVRVYGVRLEVERDRFNLIISAENIGETVAMDIFHYPIFRTARYYEFDAPEEIIDNFDFAYSPIRGEDPPRNLDEPMDYLGLGKDLASGEKYGIQRGIGALSKTELDAFANAQLLFEVVIVTKWWNVYGEVQFKETFWQTGVNDVLDPMVSTMIFDWRYGMLQPERSKGNRAPAM